MSGMLRNIGDLPGLPEGMELSFMTFLRFLWEKEVLFAPRFHLNLPKMEDMTRLIVRLSLKDGDRTRLIVRLSPYPGSEQSLTHLRYTRVVNSL